MTDLHDENPNPYRSPATESGVPLLAPHGEVDLVMLKNFRKQIHSLGAVWLIIGGLVIAIGVWLLVQSGGQDTLLASPFFSRPHNTPGLRLPFPSRVRGGSQ